LVFSFIIFQQGYTQQKKGEGPLFYLNNPNIRTIYRLRTADQDVPKKISQVKLNRVSHVFQSCQNTWWQEFKTAGLTVNCSGTDGHQRALTDAVMMPRAEKTGFLQT